LEPTSERRIGPEPDFATIVGPDHPAWPDSWKQMTDPPPTVHVTGDASLLTCSAIAMVGTRRATARGLALARGFAADLAARGWLVVSGLALGIDGAAHRGALEVGGRTCAVMATGSDRTYPGAHRSLRARIDRSGCCLTEFEEGTTPYKSNFRQRNRLIAGLAQAVIVVEAPHKSGALITANRALDYNREVFAVPGPVDLESSRGCHRLLREGAHLMESVADVERVLGQPENPTVPGIGPTPGPDEPVAGSASRWILDRLDLQGVSRDDLRERWPGTEAAWIEGLTALELAGLVSRLPGGRLARRIWTG
jgi:DNA processing protein